MNQGFVEGFEKTAFAGAFAGALKSVAGKVIPTLFTSVGKNGKRAFSLGRTATTGFGAMEAADIASRAGTAAKGSRNIGSMTSNKFFSKR